MKKIISIIISIVMIANCMIFVASATNITETTVFSEDGAYTYALEVAGKHIGISGDATDMSASYSISNGYKIVGSADPTCRVFFTFMNNECIGRLNVAFLDGRYFATYYSADLPLITDMYENDLPFTLYYANDRVYLIDNEKSYVFNGADDNDPFFSNVLEKTPITTGAITVTVSENRYARAVTNKFLDVPIVLNDVDIFGRGLCWAACVASVVMYKTSYTGLTSLGVWGQLVSSRGLTIDESFAIDSSYTQIAFEEYGVRTSSISNGMTFNTVKTHINRNNPVVAGILPDSSSNVGHMVVISGYNQTDSEYWYQLMDCNVTEKEAEEKKYIYIILDDPTDTDFLYVTANGDVYNNWTVSIW